MLLRVKIFWGKTWEIYNNFLQKQPTLTKATLTALLYGAGDLISQCLEKRIQNIQDQHSFQKKTHFDLQRTVSMFSFGFMFAGPFFHYWYTFLDSKLPGINLKTLGKKICLDQIFCAPIVYGSFFPFIGVMKGQSFQEIEQNFKNDFVSTYLADCVLWIPANFLNFRFVPPSQRVLCVGVISFVWSIYLAFVGGGNGRQLD